MHLTIFNGSPDSRDQDDGERTHMAHIQTQAEWEEEMSAKIWDYIRKELYLDLRFLDLALSALTPRADRSLFTCATDGVYLYYAPQWLFRVFEDNVRFLDRLYLHSVLHCIFAHLWMAGARDQRLWGIACDIAVEYTIDHMDKPCTKRILTWTRQRFYETLKDAGEGISAAVIYRRLRELDEAEVRALHVEFYTDDHHFWPAAQRQKSMMERPEAKQWNKIAKKASLQQQMSGADPKEGERLFAAQVKAEKSRRSYRDFLKKFTVFHEELHTSPDEFDLSFYTYGLRLYGNLPLIEPLETREVRRIREFVIVLDTSGSTSGALVENFLRETVRILSGEDYFFKRCKIRLLQCDDRIRSDFEITDPAQLDALPAQFTLSGGGGTDFRPAFAHVNALMESGVLKNPGGLLYFTDGLGIYPKKRPPYPAAFLFLTDFDAQAVPPWAMCLRLEPEEFQREKEKG